MKRRSPLIGICTLLLAGASLATISAPHGAAPRADAVPAHAQDPGRAPNPGAPPMAFGGGAPSIDKLIDEFLDAVEHHDTNAMHRLRVTKDEYLEIIVPGTVEKGEAPRQISEQPREFFWALSDRKSRYAADAIVGRFGGLHFTRRELRFSKGVTPYLWYTAYGQVRLDLHTPGTADVFHLRTGTIAEVGGRYKFLAFNWND
jgi:hypothetical protein